MKERYDLGFNNWIYFHGFYLVNKFDGGFVVDNKKDNFWIYF